MASKKSYDAFSSVDELVAKPVLGSDGAASWQEFRKESSPFNKKRQSVAPSLPMKKVDRVALYGTIAQERAHEAQIRKQAGEASVGEGYTVFKRKNDSAEEAAAKKRQKLILERVRPDNAKYFIPAATFDGWKHDYVFTTKDRGTGYYWDGTDSLKKLTGEGITPQQQESNTTANTQDVAGKKTSGKEKTKKKKKKKSKDTTTASVVVVEDSNNPMEQVANAIRRRNEMLGMPPSLSSNTKAADVVGLPVGWEKATDAASGKVYYFNRKTGERSWDVPSSSDPSNNKAPTIQQDDADGTTLPAGWKCAKDPNSGKEYFYHTNGETRWERPTVLE